MKYGFLLLILLSGMMLMTGLARAGDVSCQVDLLKPKMNTKVIIAEADKPADITVAQAKERLQLSRETQSPEASQSNDEQQHPDDEPTAENSEVTNKTAKKSSRLGGIFDILLPSKLRNPVK